MDNQDKNIMLQAHSIGHRNKNTEKYCNTNTQI